MIRVPCQKVLSLYKERKTKEFDLGLRQEEAPEAFCSRSQQQQVKQLTCNEGGKAGGRT